MSQETEERKISQVEFEQLCFNSCDWVTPVDAANLNEDVLWCRICRDLCHFFDAQYFHMNREMSAGDDCRKQIRGIVEHRWSAPFDGDVIGIANKYIKDAMSKADILKEE
jgi:hypothetical protein